MRQGLQDRRPGILVGRQHPHRLLRRAANIHAALHGAILIGRLPCRAYAERRWTSRDGLNLFARDYAGASGEARLPVICLHGLTRNSKDFEDVAPIIAGWGRRVIVPDVRGRGQSDRDPNPKNYRPPIYARDVLEMMAALDVPRAVFLGTSMGGIITMTLAALRPKAIAAAILNDVGPAIAPEGVARILSYAGKPVDVRSWDDAADYVRRTNVVAFPDYGAERMAPPRQPHLPRRSRRARAGL